MPENEIHDLKARIDDIVYRLDHCAEAISQALEDSTDLQDALQEIEDRENEEENEEGGGRDAVPETKPNKETEITPFPQPTMSHEPPTIAATIPLYFTEDELAYLTHYMYNNITNYQQHEPPTTHNILYDRFTNARKAMWNETYEIHQALTACAFLTDDGPQLLQCIARAGFDTYKRPNAG